MADIIYDVDLAVDVQAFILSNNDDITFADDQIKKDILSMDNDTLLRVGRVINSPTKIVSVNIVDADFLEKNLFVA